MTQATQDGTAAPDRPRQRRRPSPSRPAVPAAPPSLVARAWKPDAEDLTQPPRHPPPKRDPSVGGAAAPARKESGGSSNVGPLTRRNPNAAARNALMEALPTHTSPLVQP